MVKCADDTLYTGVTTDVKRRVAEHNSEKLGAKYTRHRQPVTLVFQEEVGTRSAACKFEYKIKQLPKAKKLELISQKLSN